MESFGNYAGRSYEQIRRTLTEFVDSENFNADARGVTKICRGRTFLLILPGKFLFSPNCKSFHADENKLFKACVLRINDSRIHENMKAARMTAP